MKTKKPIVGITVGTWDLCHTGHMLVFREAKEHCDYLIVGLQKDPSTEADVGYRDKRKNKPIMSLAERKIILEGIKYIDKIFVYSTEKNLYNKLKKIKHDVRIIGEDWKDKKFTGYDLPVKFHYNKRDYAYSSTQLRQRVYEEEKKLKKNLFLK